jgi:hypothetical protein
VFLRRASNTLSLVQQCAYLTCFFVHGSIVLRVALRWPQHQGIAGKTVPVVIHGDDGTGQAEDATLALTWSPLWGPKNSKLNKMLFSVLPQRWASGDGESMAALLAKFVMELNLMMDSAAEIHVIVLFFRSDLKFRHEALQSVRWCFVSLSLFLI